MTAGGFALVVALGTAWKVVTGVTSSTALVTSTTETNTSVSNSETSSFYSYEIHPDYLDCNNSNPILGTIGDGVCDTSLNVASCGWDGGDCCVCTCNNSMDSYGCTSDYYCEDASAPLYLKDLGCYNETLQAPQVERCPQNQVDEWVVDNTANAMALAETTRCSSGDFNVKWKGHVNLNATIHVLNGTSLHITGVGDAVADGGGEVQIFFVYNGSLDLNNMTITNGTGTEGGAMTVAADSKLFANNVTFSFNTAQNEGGAVFVSSSIVELVSTIFYGNSARNGGAIFMHNSALVGSGNINFTNNNVSQNGGALYIMNYSYLGWNMRRVFNDSLADFPSFLASSYFSFSPLLNSWVVIDEDGVTNFLDNNAGGSGGAMYAQESEIAWSGTTSLGQNSAQYGGAIYMKDGTSVTSEGVTTFASNYATFAGGAIGATGWSAELTVNGSTIFKNNMCGGNGGAIDLTNIDFVATGNLSFAYNLAVSFGGALYASQVYTGPELTGVTFLGNAAESGGAVFFSAVGTDAYQSGISEDVGIVYYYASTFNGCRFDGNSATSTGGAIHSTAGSDYVWNTTFTENSADIGGGMRVSGAVYLSDSSFEDNKSGDGGGPAVSNGGVISKMARMSFSGNGYYCSPDAFLDLNEIAVDIDRYDIVCDGCDIECEGCIIEGKNTIPVCSELPAHTDSQGGIATLETLVLDPGYWRATDTSRMILECFNEKACRGGVTGNPEYCSTGFEGPYCAVCSQGYVRTISHGCSKCSSKTSFGPAVFAGFAGLAGLLLLVVVYIMIRIERHPTEASINPFTKILAIQSLKIIIVSWQIITQFSEITNVVYPRLYQGLLDVVALVNFDFSWLLSAGCFDVDFYVGLIATTSGPFAAMALLGVTYTIALRRNHGSEVGQRIVRRKHVSAAILIAFLVYSSASSVIFRTFACDPLDDGKVYLRADYRIDCESPKHIAFQIYSGFMIAVYPLGVPILFAILLFRNRQVLENVNLRTYNGELVQQSTSSLWKPYKPSVFYYEVVECGRRLLLAGIVVFIYPNTAAQIAMTLAMAFIFALMSERLNPYESQWDSWVARIGHVMVVLTMFVALLTKVDVSDEGTQSQNMLAGILVTAHIAMVLTGVTEAVLLIYSVQQADSPLPSPRRISVLPVDDFLSTHDKHAERV